MFTSLYVEDSPARVAELAECLMRNVTVAEVDSVCVFLEGDIRLCLDSKKIVSRAISHRPLYEDFFLWANELIMSDDDLSVVCNSDIFFDATLGALSNKLRCEQCAALTRWDQHCNGQITLLDRNDSQDAWVFRGKIRPVCCDYLMGVPRCDNRLLHELRVAGYEVINPAFSIRAILSACRLADFVFRFEKSRHQPQLKAFLYLMRIAAEQANA